MMIAIRLLALAALLGSSATVWGQSSGVMQEVARRAVSTLGIARWDAGGFTLTTLTSRAPKAGCWDIGVWYDRMRPHIGNYRSCGGSMESLGSIGRLSSGEQVNGRIKLMLAKAVQHGSAKDRIDEFELSATRSVGPDSGGCQVEFVMRSQSLLAFYGLEDMCR